MMKLLIPFLSAFIFLTFNYQAAYAQMVKNQTEQIKSLKPGKYISYEVQESKDGSGFVYEPFSLTMELVEVNPEKNFTEHKYLVFNDGDGSDKLTYLPVNMAFPVTLARIGYEGNEKLQKKVGYVPVEISERSTQKIVVIDGIIYNITNDFNENETESIRPFSVYIHEDYGKASGEGEEKKKKKKSLKEKMKMLKAAANGQFSDKGGRMLRDIDAVGTLRDYLTKAVAQQKKIYPQWSKESNNAERIKLLEERRELMYAAMRKYNEDLMDTPEWRRIQENNAFWEKHDKASSVTIENKTGRDIWLYEKDSNNGTVIRANSSGKFDCKSTYYYCGDGNSGTSNGTVGPLGYSANSSCGGSVKIQ